ncbi:GNAT family N-acetyltransferase [Amycolatopsis sp. 195334CR]|uniref:GNAT family N-acetyltransferase n=1 Tax=Amycolatopsis sp. 195334CR TaxID=2814588 RepID=UPI001A8E5183|nr:GNAT family N-acetyltransferase [Amycolatopsis sp. 195334CR]MBN6039443.1 GNAT family N-acetyltransferase [Amycolatopsis sp. 195334CR]
MNDLNVRAITEAERRVVYGLLVEALHAAPPDDATWGKVEGSFPADRKLAAFDGETPVGLTSSFATSIAVPGGKTLPAAAVDGVAVRADHTRRGVVTSLLTEQLRDCLRRGDLIAALHASEATIYGRFGYGAAVLGQSLRIVNARASLRPEAPSSGRVRLLDGDEAITRIPELYRRIGPHRPGMIERPDLWWPAYHNRLVRAGGGEHRVAVHTGPGGEDGFVVFRTSNQQAYDEPDFKVVLEVRDLHAADPAATTDLWRFLIGMDLVAEIRAPARPVDEPLRALLTDARAVQTTGVEDHNWLRLLDAGAALNARTYRDAPPVVLGLEDRLLPENTGAYRISADGVTRTDAPAQLQLTAEALAMLYLGEWTASALAGAGRITVTDPAALPAADELFRVGVRPWCGTYF